MLNLVPFYDHEMERANEDFNHFFDDFFRTGLNRMSDEAFRLDVAKKDDCYEITADLPGIDKSELEVSVDSDVLTIAVHKEENSEEKDDEKHYLHKERRTMNASRQIYLEGVDENKINAKLENGVLTVTLPFEEVVSTKKSIQID